VASSPRYSHANCSLLALDLNPINQCLGVLILYHSISYVGSYSLILRASPALMPIIIAGPFTHLSVPNAVK